MASKYGNTALCGVLLLQEGSVKVKCVAMLLQVYLKSNEISFEVKRPQNSIPVLVGESRDKNGKGSQGSSNAGEFTAAVEETSFKYICVPAIPTLIS